MAHMRRSFQIVATGQPWPPMMARHHATAVSPDGQLVWHVLENICPHLEVRMDARGDYGPGGECQHCRVSLTRRGTERWIPA
jgi:hypothetical protein